MTRRRSWSKRLRSAKQRAQTGYFTVMLLLVANALGIALIALAIIGAPPSWRIDALWVYQQQDMVRVAVFAIGAALCASVMVMLSRRPRGLMLSLWLTAFAVAAVLLWPQIEVIAGVLLRRLG